MPLFQKLRCLGSLIDGSLDKAWYMVATSTSVQMFRAVRVWCCFVMSIELGPNLRSCKSQEKKKTILRTKTGEEFELECDDNFKKLSKQNPSATMNAFHLISLSESFYSLLLFPKTREEKEEMRFTMARPVSNVISRLEEVAKAKRFNVKKSNTKLRL
ncbi:hypothetical protein K1719_047452 [Acacia pycnantha]|nr:hypothetical protein K1719_047452 [Acacia pycnantha]